MGKRTRSVPRASEVSDPSVSRTVIPKPADPRQAELFAFPFVPPCKPKLATKVPAGPLWQYEIKQDGYRVQAHLDGAAVRLFTKSGLDWAERMPGIAAALRQLACPSAVIDGEAVIVDDEGVSDFFAIHKALRGGSAPPASLVAFDLLELTGEDLRERPLAERRARLAELLVHAPPGLELSPHVSEGGQAMFEAACRFGLEGIVAKRQDAPYRSGYVDTWLKVKCTKVEAFAVIGFDPEGSRGLSSLKLARLTEGGLKPCGSVGSGLTGTVARDLRSALDSGAHVVVDVESRGWTPAGELRHPVFKSWHRG